MGWQDAPLASPTGPKPAWSSAPLATQSNAPAGGAVPEDPRGDSFFSGNGLLSRVGNFLQRADRASERGAHNLVSGLERLGQTGANAVGLDGVGDYLGGQATENETAAAAPVPGATDWQTVKAQPNVRNILSYIGEAAGGATPGLAAVAVNPLLFGASRAGDVARIRATNNGETAPTLGDVAAAAPTAAIDTFLMRGGLNAMLKGSLGKAAAREALAQGGMPVADYAGETVGTKAPFVPMEAADRGLAGVVAGAPLGVAGAGLARLRAQRTAPPTPEEALSEGSLNGETPAWMQAPIAETLQSVGSDPSHFSTPERAARAAERVQTVRPQEPSSFDRQWAAIIGNEGGTNHDGSFRTSPKGAVGPAQVMPATAPDAARMAGLDWDPLRYKSDAAYNEALGKAYYQHQLNTFGDPAKAAAAYNAGPGAVEGAIRKYGDEWLDHLPAETRNYVRNFTAKVGSETVYRAPGPRDDPFESESSFERTDAPESPTNAEREAGVRYENMATGDNTRPFMDSTDDPEGNPGFWERRAQMREEELRKEWEASRQSAGETSGDPSAKYGANNYGQRPHMDENGIFARTDDGHIADVNGKPVAFRNVKDAARFAVKNKLAGDFEPHIWAANSARVVLTRRPGSIYGERPATPEGPAEPAAGRSQDESQRLIADWQKAPLASEIEAGRAKNEPPVSEGERPAASTAPEVAERPAEPNLRAERGSETDRSVPRETENVPAGPERFDQAPPPREDDFYPGGTFERPRPDGDIGKEPPEPQSFARSVINHLAAVSKRSGINHRISAENAINHGVEADMIFHNPKARYPTIKVQFQRLFASEKAPLNSRAKPVRIHQLDYLGEHFDPREYGVPADEIHGARIDPEHIGRLLNDSIHGDAEAVSREDPNYEARKEWLARHNAAMEFESRYGDRWATMPDEELDRIDAEEHHDARLFDMLNHVLGDEAPKEGDYERDQGNQAPEARPAEENSDGGREPERDAGEARGREPAAEDALIPERPTDGRDALQRRADAGLKPDAEQKPAGSDGGLFDTQDTTGDLYERQAPKAEPAREKGSTVSRRGILKGGASIAAIAAGAKLLPGRRAGEPGGFEVGGKKYPTSPRLLESIEAATKGPIDVTGPLREVATNSANPAYRALARLLMHHLKGVQVLGMGEYNNTGRMPPSDLGEGTLGVTHFNQDGKPEIWLIRHDAEVNGFNERTLLHEAVHAALLQHYGFLSTRLAGNDPAKLRSKGLALEATPRPGAQEALDRVLDLYREYGKKVAADSDSGKLDGLDSRILNAATSPDEMLAYAATEPHVQEYMRQVRGDPGKNLWQRFVDAVRHVLGMKPTPENATLLSDILDATSSLLRDAAEHPEPRVPGKPDDDNAGLYELRGKILEPDADPGEIIRKAKDLAAHPVKTTKGLLKALDRFGSAVAYSSDGALRTLARHYDSPTIVKLADMFQSRAGADDATGETYDGALKRNNGRFRSRLDETLDPFIGNKAAMERIRDLLADPDRVVRSTDKERAAAREIRDLLSDVIAYRKEAGEDIGEVKNYFPRVVDSLAVANEPTKFKAAAEKLYRDLGVDDPGAAAEAWMQRILDTHAGLDGGEEFLVNSGKPSSSKSREFGPKADQLLRDFMQKDPLLVLSDYITGSVRRAEQTRRFGPKGAENSKERGEWMSEHGSKTQWDVMLDKIREELRASGEDADGVVRQVKAIRDGNMGRLGTAGVRVSRAVSTIHVWNQLSTLQKVTFSSIGDTAMGFIAGKGGMGQGTRHFLTSLKETARLIETFGKRDLSDAHRWAEAIGVVGHGTASQLIQARMDAAPGAVRHASLLNKFYHKVGIEQLTQGGRVAAAENAKVFLDTLSGDMLSGSARTRQRATFYLKELGIKDPAAFADWVRNNGVPDRRAVQRAREGSREAEYAAAVVRFADQTILMPSRAMKPAWANHPIGSLLFALQSYNAAFTQNVLKRVGRLGIEAAKNRDPHLLVPALGLTVLVGMNALQDYLRTAVFGGTRGDESEQQYAFRILDRAGLTGMASPIFNAMFGLKYHRSVSQSLQGSVLGRAGQAIDAGGGLFIGNSDNTNTAERKAAGLLYDLVIDPAANTFGAKYLRGAAGTAAIMGTGNKKGGVLPGDRDAFVDAVAGPGKT